MAKEKFDETEGVWRTVGGRKIFIRDGQDLASAMIESGKFDKKSKNRLGARESYRKIKQQDEKEGKNKKLYSKEKKDEIDEDKPSLREEYRKGETREEYRENTNKEIIRKDIKETTTSTKDSNGKDSLSRYMDKDGNLTPEREAVHERIIEEYFDGKSPVSDGEKLYYMTGGGSGTGKSSFVSNKEGRYFEKDFGYKEGKDFTGNMIKIDADDIKAKLYTYGKEMNHDKHRFSSPDLHEESSALSKRINEIATKRGYNTMLDSTGDGSPEKLKSKIDDAHAKGYKVIAVYGTCDYEKALNNNLNRYIEKASVKDPTARYVNEVDVLDLHRNVSNTLIADAKYFDKVDLYDMNDFGNVKKIASGGNGKSLVVDKNYQKEYNNFKAKGDTTDDMLDKMAKKYSKVANQRVKEENIKRIKRSKSK